MNLGRQAHGESLVELLAACHARIRHHVAVAARVATARPDEPSLADAAAAVHRYFSEALPLHVADEDDSIDHRLRGRDPALDAVLDQLAAEHRDHAADVAALCAACAAMDREALAPVAARLAAAFEAHLAREEAVVFPAIAALPAADQDAIVAELRARRASQPVPPASP